MFNIFKKKAVKQNRVIVLGIDGVPYSLLARFIDSGIMPNLAKVTAGGTLSPMTASIPEVSSTSWSTFMTGVNPGRHGIYGFTEVQKNTYKWKFPNADDLKSATLWDIAGKNGRRSVVLNVPSTYPARELKGVLTSGFVSLDLKKATYPDSAYEYLKSIGYKMDVDTQKARESSAALADNIKTTFDIRKKAILHFLNEDDWDLFIGVVTETDRLHHYLWAALDDEGHAVHSFFLDFYRDVDALIGEMHKKAGDEIPFIILSDHGFTTIKKEIYLNSWLKERGYLKFTKETPDSFETMHSESRVFALDPARFYIHSKDKYSRGCVDAGEYEGLRNKLKHELLSLEVDGEKVIKEVLFKEEAYSGALVADAPDLVALPHKGYDLKSAINKTEISGMGHFTGGHTRDDATFFINRKIDVSDINIVDVGPTIISLLGIDEKGLDGRCLV